MHSDKNPIPIDFSCSEQFDAMSAEGQGRRCAACDTIVVDFSEMEPEQIRSFLHENSGQKLCGRYRTEHTDIPTPRLRFGLRLLTRIERMKTHRFVRHAAAALLILALGLSSCRRHTVGKFSKGDSHGLPRNPHATTQSSR